MACIAPPHAALSRTIQPKHALEMLLTGDFVDAERAMQLGSTVVDEEFLRDETLSLAENLPEIELRFTARQTVIL